MVALQLGGVVDHGTTPRNPDGARRSDADQREPAAARSTLTAEHAHHPGVGTTVDDDRAVPLHGRHDRIAQDHGQRLQGRLVHAPRPADHQEDRTRPRHTQRVQGGRQLRLLRDTGQPRRAVARALPAHPASPLAFRCRPGTVGGRG